MIENRFPWHKSLVSDLNTAIDGDRLGHGLLIEGPHGLGKLDLAFLVAGAVLDKTPVVEDGRVQPPSHPDFRWVTLETDDKGRLRKQVTVDQVREACRALSLTSYAGGAKVTVVAPAERMNRNAANSLLKTLEEPNPDTLLILVRARTDTLPATIASRCQRLRVPIPETGDAELWLRERHGDADWPRLLHLAGGAPLTAADYATAGYEAVDGRFSEHMAGLLCGRMDPIEVAAEWASADQGLEGCLRWLSAWTDHVAWRRQTGSWRVQPPVETPETVIDAIPAAWIYWYRDEVHRAMRRMDGALNVELTLENLLVPWAQGLEPQEGHG